MTSMSKKNVAASDTFLAEAGWDGATRTPIAGDASSRAYERLSRLGERAILMIAPPSAESASCPPDASAEERAALGYNAAARLAGPNLNAFLEVARLLRQSGLAAPDIYAADTGSWLAIIEDLGDDLFARAIENGADEQPLYEAAIDALSTLAAAGPAAIVTDAYTMLSYDDVALKAETDLLTQWYWPLKNGAPIADDLHAEYAELWAGILKKLSTPHTVVLRDFHAENLLWLPERPGIERVGVIDFQDALYGHAAYDLVSLLEDARRDVDPSLVSAMIRRYTEKSAQSRPFNAVQFNVDYAILAAQRNAKILGVFARLAERDGKTRYLDLLPRVEAHFCNDLKRPGLEPLRTYIAKHLPGLAR